MPLPLVVPFPLPPPMRLSVRTYPIDRKATVEKA
jgi:hypothetical protein